MKMRLAIEYHDGTTVEVIPSPLAMIGWEKASGRRMTDLASEEGGGMGMTDMVRMAYEQVRLQNGSEATPDFEEWAMTLADINPVGQEDPTSGGEDS